MLKLRVILLQLTSQHRPKLELDKTITYHQRLVWQWNAMYTTNSCYTLANNSKASNRIYSLLCPRTLLTLCKGGLFGNALGDGRGPLLLPHCWFSLGCV